MSNHKIGVKSSDDSSKLRVIFMAFVAILVFLPEITYAENLSQLATKTSTFVVNDLKKLFVTGGGILGTSGALVKGNLKLAAAVGVVAIMLSLFLTWVDGGMQLFAA